MQSQGRAAEADEDVLEDAVAFAGVSKYPARVKCALLGWMAWKDATAQARSTATEDAADAGRAEQPMTHPGGALAATEDIEEAMRDVVDPELGINVVDLGLVYGVDRGRGQVAVTST